jgi:hypothetical protein
MLNLGRQRREERGEREGRRVKEGGRKRWVRKACNSKDVGTLGYC